MIPRLVQMLKVRIVACQPQELFFAEAQVFEFVLEDDARVQQPVLDDVVAGGLHLVGGRYLRQVVLAVVWVVGEGVFWDGVHRKGCDGVGEDAEAVSQRGEAVSGERWG